jgi:RNA polymerase sigma-70 factor (ECF subfamily)
MAEHSNEEDWTELLTTAFQDDYKGLYTEAKRVLKNEFDAEDVIQDVYMKLADLKVAPEIHTNPKGYFRRTVHNAALDRIRSRKARKKDKSLEDVELVAPGSEREQENVCNELERVLASMSEEAKEIVELHCVDGYSDSEIAEMRGETRSRIASILSRSRARAKGSAGRS